MKTSLKASVFTPRSMARSTPQSMARVAAISLVLAGGLSACTTQRVSRGYIEDRELTDAVHPGIDNVNSVKSLLGSPSIKGTFDENIWYYIYSMNVRKAFRHEKATYRSIIQVDFNDRGIVTDTKRYSLADGRSINPVNDKTPTRGKELGFFEQIFGNIGRFSGVPGQGGQGGGPGR